MLQEYADRGIFPFLYPPQKCSNSLRVQKKEKNIFITFLLFRELLLILGTDCVSRYKFTIFSGNSYGINEHLVILTVDILYLIFLALKVL